MDRRLPERNLCLDRHVILNAFKPNSEVELPAGFAGRKDQIRQLTDALLTDRSCPVIYGDRGLGKNSLALQLARIALGDTELLEEIGAGRPRGDETVRDLLDILL